MADNLIGNYRVIKELGAGGMGAVYLAQHSLLGRKAAVKVLLPEMSRNDEIVRRFFNEAKAATAIKHPGIVQIYDFGHREDGSAYIAMEFLEGEGLDRRIKTAGALPVQQALRFTGQIASALSAAHHAGIFHRDLKPANLFLVPDQQVAGGERIKILDFGIAKVFQPGDPGAAQTQAGSIMGSPAYMAPEQCQSAGEIDHRADLYSVGCILFEMLCGRPPFDGGGNGPIAIMASQLQDEPPLPSSIRPELTAEMDALVMRLLAKHPSHRPQDAGQLAEWVGMISGEQVSFHAAQVTTQVDLGAGHPSGDTTARITEQSTGAGASGARLIDRLAAGHTAGNTTGGPRTGTGKTGATTGTGSRMQAAAQRTAGTGLSRTGASAAGESRGSRRRALWIVPVVAAVGALALWLAGRTPPSQPGPAAAVTAKTPTSEQPAAKQAPPEPRLSFYSLEEQKVRRNRRQAVASLMASLATVGGEDVATGAMATQWRLPSFSFTSLLSGNFLGSVVDSLSVIWEPEPEIITWKIQTEPPGATLLRDGEVVGTTEQPMIIELDPAPEFKAQFTVRLDGYRDATIDLVGDTDYDEVLTLVPKAYATVISEPEGAEVFDAAGELLGTAPMQVELAEDGSATAVTLRFERYEDTTVEVAGSESYEQTVPLPAKIFATVESRPEGAQVLAQDGSSLGTTPVEIPLVRGDDGEVQPVPVTLTLDRYEDAAVELAGSKSFTERVRLQPKIYATVESRPEGAQVTAADGTVLGTTPVSFEVPRDAQPALVTVTLEGHVDAEVRLRGGKSFTETVRMRPLPRVTIISEPAGAEVLDASGTSLGAAPVEVQLSGAGEPMAFTVRHDGYHDEKIEVASKRDKKLRVKLARELGQVTVSISSEPAGAKVYRGNELVGKTPIEDRFDGVAERVKYRVEHEGYATKTMRVPGDRDSAEAVTLRKCRPQRRGTLTVVSVYEGC
ncbi:serine/threonine-protein kinase [Haliangium sp.]|uniref:serine/threonine-protein kinase n=1 Tax=Haliangium sp. TaxID=2663208 RepID=UPI003D09C25A